LLLGCWCDQMLCSGSHLTCLEVPWQLPDVLI
jgi:hypothetical protein